MLSWLEIESRAVAFQHRWKKATGDERQEAQTFEKDLMDVFGVPWLEGLHEYQVYLSDGSIGYIDYLLPGKILIEMKSKGKSLAKAHAQAMSYVRALKPEEYPTLVMVSDFDKIEVYNLKKDHRYKPFRVSQLKQHLRIFSNVAGYGEKDSALTEIEVNTKASYKMAELHDCLKENGYGGSDLEVYLVRLLFCLFAEDVGIFERGSFGDYIKASSEDGSDLSGRIMMLFSILNTPLESRQKNLSEELQRFRYINGKLFEKPLPPAFFDKKMRGLIIECSEQFDWSQISPAIFGAMFQGVMDEGRRRELGAHYTSEENILKVIRPLFLDDLYDEFERSKSTREELLRFQDKLASLLFLDPAMGCGNFLIVTYHKLRELEFEVLKLLYDNRQLQMVDAISKIRINQFYGIEYEEFPCQIAQVSIILMKHLMDMEIGNHFGTNIVDFPIRNNANIVHGNALTLDWAEVCPKERLSYIIGNPPFVGARLMSTEQSAEVEAVFKGSKGAGNLDYVAAWYYKAAEMVQGTRIGVAFVSTNSISQGQQVALLWRPLLQDLGMEIDYAYETFKWSNEAKGKAAVHCVIIGFSDQSWGHHGPKKIFRKDGTELAVEHINGYLVGGPDVYVDSRSHSLCGKPEMGIGNQPIDDGNYLFTKEEMEAFIQAEPASKDYFYEFYGAKEFINKKPRYCLLAQRIPLGQLRKMPRTRERVSNVQDFRAKSKRKSTLKLADTPMEFQVTNLPETNYLLVPRVSSENRSYIPIGYMPPSAITSDSVLIVADMTLADFAVITSSAHMAWMRTVAGRLKSDYRYSAQIVYNNFPWPTLTREQEAELTRTAQAILDVRAKYPDASLADLYDPVVMPPELRKAHRANDEAVRKAYGAHWASEEDCIADLLHRYEELVASSAQTK